ncbi:MaoC/PaaZ C-terminal domain-containing protein [Dactylosporangium sp. NPDC000555]|uniref:MaoC/PaaZ C-terminal domain-containing protein n=1 Tax=Dactylosporangium sp. NPDC000555 TaxID=3154260 RepID=UPI00332931C7
MFTIEQLGSWSRIVEFPVTRDRIAAYAAATNDLTPQHVDGTVAPPVFAVVPGFEVMAEATLGVAPPEAASRILHGRHDIHVTRPIVPGDLLRCRAQVIGVHARSSGVAVTTLLETTGAAGDPVNEQYFTGFFRGATHSGDAGHTAPDHSADPQASADVPELAVTQHIDTDQPRRYAEASGDFMPVHLDDAFARKVGLPGVIVHGLCTMAFTSHALAGGTGLGDPTRLRRLAVRFSAPAFPGRAITTNAWRIGGNRYCFETVSDDGAQVIKDGLAEYTA